MRVTNPDFKLKKNRQSTIQYGTAITFSLRTPTREIIKHQHWEITNVMPSSRSSLCSGSGATIVVTGTRRHASKRGHHKDRKGPLYSPHQDQVLTVHANDENSWYAYEPVYAAVQAQELSPQMHPNLPHSPPQPGTVAALESPCATGARLYEVAGKSVTRY